MTIVAAHCHLNQRLWITFLYLYGVEKLGVVSDAAVAVRSR